MDEFMLQMMQLNHQGYNCSQILLILGLESRGRTNPGLVRAMAGLAYGCGSGCATCGALTGGCCLLAFCATTDDEDPHPAGSLPPMLQELEDWFVPRAGGLTCEMVCGENGPAASGPHCSQLVADTFAKVTEILSQYGLA